MFDSGHTSHIVLGMEAGALQITPLHSEISLAHEAERWVVPALGHSGGHHHGVPAGVRPPTPQVFSVGQIKRDAWLRVKDTRLLAVLDWNPGLFGPCVGS